MVLDIQQDQAKVEEPVENVEQQYSSMTSSLSSISTTNQMAEPSIGEPQHEDLVDMDFDDPDLY